MQYVRELRFSTVADLMAEVVFNISPSIGAAYQANIEQMTVSRKSVYNKLNGIEPGISAALVHDSVAQFAPIIEKLRATLPALLRGYHAKILDGNHFSATEHRIGELRTIGDAPLPGKALVVLDPVLKLATHVFPCEDGHAKSDPCCRTCCLAWRKRTCGSRTEISARWDSCSASSLMAASS